MVGILQFGEVSVGNSRVLTIGSFRQLEKVWVIMKQIYLVRLEKFALLTSIIKSARIISCKISRNNFNLLNS